MDDAEASSTIYPVPFPLKAVRAFYAGSSFDQFKISEFLKKTNLSDNFLYRIRQVHGNVIVHTAQLGAERNFIPEADGIFSDIDNTSLLILTADCLPVFMCASRNRVIGLFHAGWRGLQKGILESAVEEYTKAYSGKPSDLSIFIGPFIRKCCYEVGHEFEEIFPRGFQPKMGDQTKGFLDLEQVATDQLLGAGIEAAQISFSKECTFCSHDPFFSFRRNQTNSRNLSLISLTTL